ncbi:MAG: NADH-dependent [FeFe] hydrogenase, group A6 [Bacteroidota bacterium]|nr:NADH-dependent [FeFe] hydrogenase, group A6 [Bacteroidota bacterium]
MEIKGTRAPVSQQSLQVEKPEHPEHIGGSVSIEINDRKYSVPFGTTILEACQMNQIHIPTLCHHPDLCVAGVCRICVVEVEGMRTLQASCAYPITNPLKIKTTSDSVRKARKNIMDLMLSEHYGECYACFRNQNCELQKLAKEYGSDGFNFGHVTKSRYDVDHSSYSVIRDMDKCILCKRCVRTCIDLQEVGVLEAIDRGKDTHIGTFFDKPLSDVICINCGQCINRCPTAALRANDPRDEIWEAIDNPNKHVVIQTAPSPRAAIGEEFGNAPGKSFTGEMNTALRKIGFNKVFDTNFTADLTIMEEGTELILRLYKALVVKDETVALPQFTSCSPGWVKYLEHFYPEFIDNLSSAKSPQQMFGALIKTYYAELNNINPEDIVSVALMPCSAKKFECNRPEMNSSGYKDVDYGLTTRELAQMIKEAGIHLPEMEQSHFDDPFGEASGAGLIFGATGGVMEAALRSVVEFVTGHKAEDLFSNANVIPVRGFEGVKYFEIPLTEVGPVPGILKPLVPNWDWLKGVTLKIAVAHGTANAKKVMDNIKAGGKFSECHFVEFMACPGGCIGGGGQPIPTNAEVRKQRANAIYTEDESLPLRKSHENEHVVNLYETFLTDGPCGHKSHKLLHTHYIKRGKYIS